MEIFEDKEQSLIDLRKPKMKSKEIEMYGYESVHSEEKEAIENI